MRVRPANTQISLGIHPVWSVFTVRMKKSCALSYPLSAHRRLWSDWAVGQADLSLRWAHSHFVGFVMAWLKCSLSVLEEGCDLWLWHSTEFGFVSLFFLQIIWKQFIISYLRSATELKDYNVRCTLTLPSQGTEWKTDGHSCVLGSSRDNLSSGFPTR